MKCVDEDLTDRTFRFTLRVLKMVDEMPRTIAAREIAKQVVRSACSVSANCRAAKRGRSRKEFAAKLGIVREEIDETWHWLQLIEAQEYFDATKLQSLLDEAEELTRIFAASYAKAKRPEESTPSS